jgi:hypothetical protein
MNVEMCLALAVNFKNDKKAELIEELIDRLKNANRFEVSPNNC